jgi:protein O-GlcNAc transferase
VRPLRLGVTLALLGACGAPPAPPPEVDTTGMEPAVARAFEQARAAIAEQPGSGTVWGRLGMVADAHEEDRLAIACYRRAFELQPREVRWPYYLARLLAFKGTGLEEAVGLFRAALELRPDYAPGHLRLADALAELGEAEAAVAAYRRSIELDAGLARAHLGLGQVLLQLGRGKEALGSLQRAHEIEPEDATALAAISRAHLRLGERQLAEEAARQASGRAPLDAFADPLLGQVAAVGVSSSLRFERAQEYLRLGRFGEAAAELESVVAARRDDPYAHRDLGIAYRQLRRLEPAVRQLSAALAIKDDLTEARLELGLALLDLERSGEAADHLRRAALELPGDPRPPAHLGVALARGGEGDEALRQFEHAAALGSLPASANFEWGGLLARERRYAEAADRFRAALEELPDNPQLLTNLGLAMEALGRPGEAVRHYRRAMEVEPNPLAAGRLRVLEKGS